MTDYANIEMELRTTIGLARRPVAVTFSRKPPRGVPKFAGNVPSGCTFFSVAAGGMTFYTVAADHCGCAVGSCAYGLSTPENHGLKLLETMARIKRSYPIDAKDIRLLPRTGNHSVVTYSPLGETPTDPDVVVTVVRPLQGMLLQEAAMRKNIPVHSAPLGRPTCMSLHLVVADSAVTCAGCMGSRVFNALGDDEMYMLLPRCLLKTLSDEMRHIALANVKLAEQYLGERKEIEILM